MTFDEKLSDIDEDETQDLPNLNDFKERFDKFKKKVYSDFKVDSTTSVSI